MTKKRKAKSPYPIPVTEVLAFLGIASERQLDRIYYGLSTRVSELALMFLEAYEAAAIAKFKERAGYNSAQEVQNVIEGLQHSIVGGIESFLEDNGVDVDVIRLLTGWMLRVNSSVSLGGALMIDIHVMPVKIARRLRNRDVFVAPPAHCTTN